jgi:uncharacterized flavoprotein (TIGR03862 family)
MHEGATPRARVAVIGGGPAGLMAAERLAEAGLAVTVYERMPSLARKLLMAGRGGLNLTHAEPLPALLARYGSAEPWLSPIIHRFDNEALRRWAEDLGEPTFIGSSGRVFPKALKASPLLRAWLRRLDRLGVRVLTRHTWQGFTANGGLRFEQADGSEFIVHPDATILALGGASWPRLGADGSWVGPLRAAGIDVADLVPANVGIEIPWSAGFVERHAGTALKTVTLTFRGRALRGDIVITAYGLEGGPVYGLGPAIRAALARDGATDLNLDLKPDTAEESLGQRLAAAMAKGRSRSTALRRAGLAPVALALLREGGATLPADPASLAARVKAVPLRVTGQAGLARAISTAGGITRAGLDNRLMLQARPGTFACGEMLDWEAPTGGYLLQACFATGRHAAEGVIAWLGQRQG